MIDGQDRPTDGHLCSGNLFMYYKIVHKVESTCNNIPALACYGAGKNGMKYNQSYY